MPLHWRREPRPHTPAPHRQRAYIQSNRTEERTEARRLLRQFIDTVLAPAAAAERRKNEEAELERTRGAPELGLQADRDGWGH